jgi:ketosteroid isomerase-like protein
MPATLQSAAPTINGVPNTALGRMYHEHIQHILNKDIDALLDQYADDAVLISSFEKKPLYFRGRDEIRAHMQGILGINGLETEVAFWAETKSPDTLMIVEAITMQGPDGGELKMRFADSWVLKNGKIAIHFAGMTQYPDGSVA